MLTSSLPTIPIARLLLALLLVCNLTLCISWHGTTPDDGIPMAMTMADDADTGPAMQSLPCHDGGQASVPSQGECQMYDGLTAGGTGMPLLAVLLTLFVLPLLLPRGTALLDQWLRDPLLRLRGTHPPSWPRRHLMLSVLRH